MVKRKQYHGRFFLVLISTPGYETMSRDYAAYALSETMKQNGTYDALAERILQSMPEQWLVIEQTAMSESLAKLGVKSNIKELTDNIVNEYIADHLFENFADVLELASTDYTLAGHIYDGIRSINKDALTPQLREIITQADDTYTRVLAHLEANKSKNTEIKEEGEAYIGSRGAFSSMQTDAKGEGENITGNQNEPYQTPQNGLDNSIKRDKINIQFFAEKDIQNQKSISLQRALRKFEREIALHRDKIDNPQNYAVDWEDKDIREQEGLIRHWEKEINNFQKSIEERIAELKRRGDYDE